MHEFMHQVDARQFRVFAVIDAISNVPLSKGAMRIGKIRQIAICLSAAEPSVTGRGSKLLGSVCVRRGARLVARKEIDSGRVFDLICS